MKGVINRGIVMEVIGATVVVLALAALCYIVPLVHDDDSHAVTGTSIASDTTLSISLSSGVLPLDLTPTSSSGTFATTVDSDTHATIRVSTNNITGYTLGIKASNPASSSADKLISNNEKCENTPTSNKCAISSLSQPVSSAEYLDNTVEGIDLNNTWGYAPSYYNSTPNTTTTTTLDPNTNEDITTTSPINYYPAPVNGDTIATTDSPNQEDTNVNDGTLLEDTYTIDFAARIDYTPYAGSYSTTYNNQSYIITAVGNPVPYSVSYDANKPQQAPAEAEVDNMPTAQTGSVASGDTVAVILNTKVPTLGNNNPTTGEYEYAGYVFNGWCSVQPEEDNVTGYQTCPQDANTFQPGDNFGIDQTVENTQILYATWGAPARVTYNSNGLIYNNTPGDETNTVEYIPTYEGNKITGQRQNMVYTGTYNTPAYEETTPVTNYIMKGWSTDQYATEATYTDEQAIINDLTLNADNNITLYAIWTYTTIITFNGNGNDGGEDMHTITVEAGQTINLPQNTYAKSEYYFGRWSTERDGGGKTYANKANFTADVASGSLTLYAQWTKCPPNSICYNPNGANEGEGYPSMDNQAIESNASVALWPMNFKYDTTNDGHNDYGFVGWGEYKYAASTIADTDSSNDSTIYGPNQTIAVGDLSAGGMELYAIWIEPAEDSSNNTLTFQTNNLVDTALADGTTLADKPVKYVTALKDQRDNQVYAVAKLADENYWMIENLRLDDNASQPNWGDNSLSEGFGGDFIGLAAAEPANFENANANSLYNTGDMYNMPRYNNANTSSPIENMTSDSKNIYSFGNYYTWAAAIASTVNYTTGDNHTNVATSICPAGWRLPYGDTGTSGTNLGGTSGGFSYLDKQMGGTGEYQESLIASNKWRMFPNNFLLAGHIDGANIVFRGSYGTYWSTTASNAERSRYLSLYDGIVSPASNSFKYSGRSVRCVIKP